MTKYPQKNRIFFGGTNEKVLIFMPRPVICMPPKKIEFVTKGEIGEVFVSPVR